MSDQLFISHDGEPVGRIERTGSHWTLVYDDSWVRSPAAFPLSPHFPLRLEAFDDQAEDGLVEKYFDNLLPEGDARERLARRLNAGSIDAFDLLSRFGRETAGAITISDQPHAVSNDEAYRPLSPQELGERITAMRTEGGSLLRASRMSLAGAQDKLAVRFEGPFADLLASAHAPLVKAAQAMLEPEDQAPTTHILKPEPPVVRRLEHAAVNELFCMWLARAIGLEVPLAHLLHLRPHEDDPIEWVYAVQRFDRRATTDGHVRRLHQIDFLQLRNEWPSTAAKYESSGGARMPLLFSLAARYATIPAVSLNRLLNQRLLHFLVGNSDAHWKNHSLLWNAGHWDVSPTYDVVCTVAYRWLDTAPAMTIGGCKDEDRIGAEHFRDFHAECLAPHGVKVQAVRTQLKKLAGAVTAQAEELHAQLAPEVGDDNATFLREAVLPVIRRRAQLALDASAGLTPAPAVRRTSGR
jgi:serine/threonine-protein kinase HipA